MNDDLHAVDPRTERRRDPEGIQTTAWKQTLEDTEAIAEQRRDDGWDLVAIMAAQTDTASRDVGEEDTFGLMHVIPGNDADEFTEYLAYGAPISGFMYLVTEFIDPSSDRSILIAGRYGLTLADGMITSAEDEGVLHTHVKTIDGTILGSFEHQEYEPLIPGPKR